MSVVLKTSEAQRKANKKYYNKNINERKVNLKEYYEANKEILKEKRRKRYALQKQKKEIENADFPVEVMATNDNKTV